MERVVEYDCCDASRPLVATPLRSITNFYGMYKEKENLIKPMASMVMEKNAMMRWKKSLRRKQISPKILPGEPCKLLLKHQIPKTSPAIPNGRSVYDNTDLTAAIVLRRDWQQKIAYHL